MKTIIIIFGATGDLSKRKLIPAFYNIYKKNNHGKIDIIAVSRRDYSSNDFSKFINTETDEFISKDNDFGNFLETISYQKVEVDNSEHYIELKNVIEKKKEKDTKIIYYLSISPEFFPTVIDNFKLSKLNNRKTKIVIEKPFGTDLKSATILNKKINEVFREEQVYRIDHYVGKEAIQNILAFRFSNVLFEPIWNNKYIDNIQITASEDIGVGDRGGYYDTSGALRDMVQNHLFQVLTLVTMEPPSHIDSDGIRSEKNNVFRTLKLDKNFNNNIVFGQYEGYLNEKGIPENSRTETFVALKVEVCSWRFSGVPIYLRTGKALNQKSTKIVIEFKEIPGILFNKFSKVEKNRIVLEVQPNESIEMHFNIKENGNSKEIQNVTSNFSKELESKEAYQKLLEDCIVGDKTLYTSWNMLETSWKIVDDLVNCKNNCPIIHKYEKGSKGPDVMNKLLEDNGREWYD